MGLDYRSEDPQVYPNIPVPQGWCWVPNGTVVATGGLFVKNWDFRQKCKLLPIAMGLSLCVRVCLSVKVVWIGLTSAKIKNLKNDVCRF